jgi:hypothetical protein
MAHDARCVIGAEDDEMMGNQCDGCRRGLAIRDSVHYDLDLRGYMVCTAPMYASYMPQGKSDPAQATKETTPDNDNPNPGK